MPVVTHEVYQYLEVDLSQLSDSDISDVLKNHRQPDPDLCDTSFPGQMKCRIENCIISKSKEMDGVYTLERTLYLDFTWHDEEAMAAWQERYVGVHDSLLPSYAAESLEGIFIGDDICDYETDYRGICIGS
jgi:hypothetical protein